MNIGDWVYCKDEDINFKVLAIKDCFVQKNTAVWINREHCEKIDTQECPRCHEQVPDSDVYARYSFSVYAGKMCDGCAYGGYRDHCGLEGAQGNPQDLDEDYESDGGW